MKQTSSLLIITRTQGLLWRNHWNHQSGLARTKMTTWIKGYSEKAHEESIIREQLESQSSFFQPWSLRDELSLLSSSLASRFTMFMLTVHKFQLLLREAIMPKQGTYCLLCSCRFLCPTYFYQIPFLIKLFKMALHTKLWYMKLLLLNNCD